MIAKQSSGIYLCLFLLRSYSALLNVYIYIFFLIFITIIYFLNFFLVNETNFLRSQWLEYAIHSSPQRKKTFRKRSLLFVWLSILFRFFCFAFFFFKLRVKTVLLWIVSHCMAIPQFVHSPVIFSFWLWWIKLLWYSYINLFLDKVFICFG